MTAALAIAIAAALLAVGSEPPPAPAPAPAHGDPAFARCDQCHTPAGWRPLKDRVDFDHSRTGFPLLGRHADAACSACHGKRLVFQATPSACDACHPDRHQGTLGRACSRCHDERRWEPDARFAQHRETRFPLAGAHAVADCTACHVRAREETWRSTPTGCAACHDTDRDRPGIHPEHRAAAFRDACDTCHTQYAWFPARIRHDLYWPLRGAHAAADCFACHEGGRYGGTSHACWTCHQADYAGVADPPHALYNYPRQCEKCHLDLGWTPTRPAWHDGFFRISRGHHAGLGCTSCHFQGVPPQTFACITCHTKGPTDSIHGGKAGYHWENFACYACHGTGGGD